MIRNGEWTNVHAPIMTLVWSWTDAVWPGPAGYFLLQTAFYWAGLWLLVGELVASPRARVVVLAALGLFPPVFALVPHLWKDVGMLVAIIWAVALLARDHNRPGRMVRVGALAALTIACAYRHNALPLAIPFVWMLAGREPVVATTLRRSLATVAVMAMIAIVASLPNRLPGVAHRDVWGVTAAWDLAAVSLAERRMLLPPSWIDPTLTLDELAHHFKPYANVPIFESDKVRDSVGLAITPSQRRDLWQAWLSLWTDHPVEYLWHRARLTALLFGWRQDLVPDGLLVQPGVLQLGDNPPVAPREPAAQAAWNRFIARLANTPVFAFWPHLLVAAVVALASVRRRHHPLLWPVLVSAVLYVLPLPVIAPSAEWRYLIWPVFAAPLAVVLLLYRHRPAILPVDPPRG